MKNQITRTRAFVQNHRTAIAFTSGALVGAGALVAIALNMRGGNIWAFATPEQLQHLIDKPGGGIVFPLARGGDLYLVNTEHPQL